MTTADTPTNAPVLPLAPSCQKPEKESVGEHIFNYATYGGVGFLLNLGLSVAITDFFTHGKGRGILRALSTHTAKPLAKLIGKEAAEIENTTYGFWKTNALMSGGHLVMWPIKVLEDHKRHIVHRINRFLGIDTPILKNGVAAPIGTLSEDELPALYEDQPYQSWWNIIKRRALGLMMTSALGTALGEGRLQQVEHSIADGILLPAMRNTPLPALQNLAKNDRFIRYTRLVSLDQFFALITSGVTYLTNGAKKHEENAPADPLSAQTLPATIPDRAMQMEIAKRASFVEALNRQSPSAEMAV